MMTRKINRHSKECPKQCCVIEWPQMVWLKPLRVFQELALAMGKNRKKGEVLTYVYVFLLPIFVPKLITLNLSFEITQFIQNGSMPRIQFLSFLQLWTFI